MRDDEQTNEQTLKIELLSQWKLEAEFRNMKTIPHICHPRHPRRQCKNVKVRGIFSISNVKGTPVEFCTQCVIAHTVSNFTHSA